MKQALRRWSSAVALAGVLALVAACSGTSTSGSLMPTGPTGTLASSSDVSFNPNPGEIPPPDPCLTPSGFTTNPGEEPPPPPECEPPGTEGCTPGYWKNHDTWVGYSPADTVGSVFAVSGSLGSVSLLQALGLNGGGVNALLRHAVAALLNAAHPDVDYPLTTGAIVAQVNAALASGDESTIEALKNQLDLHNNLHAKGFCD